MAYKLSLSGAAMVRSDRRRLTGAWETIVQMRAVSLEAPMASSTEPPTGTTHGSLLVQPERQAVKPRLGWTVGHREIPVPCC